MAQRRLEGPAAPSCFPFQESHASWVQPRCQKHPEANLEVLHDWVEEKGPRSMALSAEGGKALAPRVLEFLRPSWHELRPGSTASKTVISLLCRLAGGPVKLKEALRAGPAGIQRPKRSRVPPNGDGFSLFPCRSDLAHRIARIASIYRIRNFECDVYHSNIKESCP